jgi:parafibromin
MSPGNPTSNHARGFFFDLSPAIDEPKPDVEKSAPTSASQSLPTSAGSYSVSKHKSGGHAQGIRDWWEANTKLSNVGGKSTAAEKRALKSTKSQFELNMVEHLPNSPLCPKNPKHKSGGTGICVYHGRNGKSRTAERATTSATEESVSYP